MQSQVGIFGKIEKSIASFVIALTTGALSARAEDKPAAPASPAVNAAPAATATPEAPPADDSKIGKIPEVVASVRLGAQPDEVTKAIGKPDDIVTLEGEPIAYYVYRARGIDVVFKGGIASTVICYNTGVDGHAKFSGAVAAGIAVDTPPGKLEGLLGRPKAVGGGGVLDPWASWGWLQITFDGSQTAIQHIKVSRPENTL